MREEDFENLKKDIEEQKNIIRQLKWDNIEMGKTILEMANVINQIVKKIVDLTEIY